MHTGDTGECSRNRFGKRSLTYSDVQSRILPFTVTIRQSSQVIEKQDIPMKKQDEHSGVIFESFGGILLTLPLVDS